METKNTKRHIDAQATARWINEGDRVLDLGCGRGVLLDYLKNKKSVFGIGVDINFEHILSCVKRNVTAYHGDMRPLLATFNDNSFDRVIFSRSIEFVDEPEIILLEGLRVGKHVTVGFINQGFWKNRLKYLLKGELRDVNMLQPRPWYRTQRSSPFSVTEFDRFCDSHEIKVNNRAYLAGDSSSECKVLPNFFASYAVYDLSKE